MEALDAIMTRRSVRKFEDRQIPDEILEKIILAGTYAPSALGIQPWAFVVVQDQGFLKKVSEYCIPILLSHMKGSGEGMSQIFKEMLESKNFSLYYNAPTVILIVGQSKNRFKDIDCSLCAENMMLAAHALGIGSCFVGATDPAYENKELMAGFKIPEGYSPIGTIVFGYPLETPEAEGKIPPKIVRV
ncbi:MAG: nitroreductase family protein [Methanomicrobiaceae archaeon]|nr:nitroreductase family protein [Methanomicrobiaceae archaeon]